ncbi:MAG TPA: hypothetical protein VFR58_04385 [Flavisolibacter sp.]|nr:hypothetical protein [Flavisolibacter sp.]
MKQQIIVLIAAIILFGCEKAAENASFSAGGNGTGGSMARFTIVGNHLYTVDKSNLKVFEISDPAQPVFKRSVPVGFEIETIFPFKDKLFIGSTSVVHIFSIADPANPQKQGEAISPEFMRRCDPVVAKDTVAYATLRTTGPCGGTRSVLAVYDVRNVQQPVHRNAITLGAPYGLGYTGNTLYVCDQLQGLVVYDITQAYAPVQVNSLLLTGNDFIDVIPFNNLLVAWVSKGMALYNITDKANPAFLTLID